VANQTIRASRLHLATDEVGNSELDPPPSLDRQLVNGLVGAIQERINSGELPLGSWLRQERLAQELGVSRMPVREALRELQSLGIVELVANRGARVRIPSATIIGEVYEVFGVLQGHAAASASELITTEQVDKLNHAVDSFEQITVDMLKRQRKTSGDYRSRWDAAHYEFHGTIVEASANNFLAETIDRVQNKIPPNLIWLALGNDLRRMKRDAAEHRQILVAIDKGDPEKARTLSALHAKRAGEQVIRALNNMYPDGF
jgi:DNA-binding GntR family transcriptional regulator